MINHNRFYVSSSICQQGTILIDDIKLIHYIKNVKRFRLDDHIRIFDGQGREYKGIIKRLSDSIIELHDVEITKEFSSIFEEQAIILICALPKTDIFSQILRLTIPLGVGCFIPLITERSDVRVSDKDWDVRVVRYQRIIESVCAQCERLFLPKIQEPLNLQELIDRYDSDKVLLCHQGEDSISIKDALSVCKDNGAIAIVVGPEGGFSDQEIACVKDRRPQWKFVHLGNYRLRTELAAIYAVGCLNYSLFL